MSFSTQETLCFRGTFSQHWSSSFSSLVKWGTAAISRNLSCVYFLSRCTGSISSSGSFEISLCRSRNSLGPVSRGGSYNKSMLLSSPLFIRSFGYSLLNVVPVAVEEYLVPSLHLFFSTWLHALLNQHASSQVASDDHSIELCRN